MRSQGKVQGYSKVGSTVPMSGLADWSEGQGLDVCNISSSLWFRYTDTQQLSTHLADEQALGEHRQGDTTR